jgi:alpha-beta hydrolase superfamily lysophospholipase
MSLTPSRLHRRRFVQAACGLAAIALPALRAWADEPAPYEVLEWDWADAKRQRPVPVRLYWPRVVAHAERVPLVVFSHGIGGSRRGYRYLGEHWSSHGIASLHLQHVGSDRNLWFGNPLGMIGRLQDAAQDKEAIERPRDLSFALDRLLGDTPFGDRIDAKRIVAAGHSYGANTTLLAAGARVEREGRVMHLRDERVSAAIVLSAPPFYGEADPARILAPVTLPTLHVTATGDVIRIPGYWSGAEDRIAVFDAVGSPRKALAVFDGGSHSMFTDRPGTGGAELNPRVKQATKELSLAYLQAQFGRGGDAALGLWVERHRAILARHAGMLAG